MPAAARPVLLVEDVEKSYGSAWALRGVSFRLCAGEVLGLLGPNGAGKTSLIRMLLDLTRPDRGRVEVLGERPTTRVRGEIGYLPEERGLYPKQRVLDVLSYLVSLAGVEPRAARVRAEAWLHRVGLEAWSRRRVRELSKGMQQKVQLGAAILHEPALLILDEPFSGLDPINRRLVSEVVLEMRAKGAGVIVSTHQMEEVEQICDRVVLLKDGTLLLHGDVTEVRRRFALSTVTVGASAGWERHPTIAPLIDKTRRRGDALEVTLAEGTESKSLLAALLAAEITVEYFSRNLPSLNEVFVSAVAAGTGPATRPAEDPASAPGEPR